ncbi:MAG: hypothetical protein E7553_02560 [Ruminococcaceae bacterium]|nr:hypothetical protein [Oscillospiraceae bacterium]
MNAIGSHLKKQNIWFYLSALSSVAIIALMFVPWITEPKAASLLTLILDSTRHVELLVFMIPVMLGIIIVHALYLFSIFRPDGEPIFPATLTMLFAGLMLFLFVFATDMAYSAITVTNKIYTTSFLEFLGIDHWNWVPLIWFVITLLQGLLFGKLAHKKPVISYT